MEKWKYACWKQIVNEDIKETPICGCARDAGGMMGWHEGWKKEGEWMREQRN